MPAPARLGDHRRGLHRRPRRSVALGVVVQLDHLHAVHVGRRDPAEVHQEHCPDGEVRHHDSVGAAPFEARPHGREVGVRQSAGPDDGVHAALGVVRHVVAHRFGDGEVDHHLGAEVHQRQLTSPTISWPWASLPTCAGSTAATSSRSGASVTARQTSWPMRPPAPTTPTLPWPAGYRAAMAGRWDSKSSSPKGPTALGPRCLRQLAGHLSTCARSTRSIRPGPRRPRAPRRAATARPDAAHPGPRVLTRQQQLGPQVALGHGQLALGDAVGGQQLQLPLTMRNTSSTCSGAVPTTTAREPASS